MSRRKTSTGARPIASDSPSDEPRMSTCEDAGALSGSMAVPDILKSEGVEGESLLVEGGERLQVSIHTLALAFDCRTRLALRLAGKEDASADQPGSTLSMLAGSWGHKAHAAYFSEESWEEALAPYEAITNTLGISTDRRGFPNLYAIYAAWVDCHPLDRLSFDILDRKTTEVSFVVPLGEIRDKEGKMVPVDLIGYMDKLVRDRITNRIVPLEHKFPGKISDSLLRKYAKWDIQITGYIVAAAATLGEPCEEAIVNAIEVAKVPSSDRKCPKHGVPYLECGRLMDIREPHIRSTFITARRSGEAQREFIDLALGICERYILPVARSVQRKGGEVAMRTPRDGKFTGACEYCDYGRWCLENERNELAFTKMLRDALYTTERLRSGLVKENV